MPSKKPVPQHLITYLCTRCIRECTRTELQKNPACALCKKNDQMQEVSRQPITPQAVEAGLMRSAERMMQSLEKAYASRPESMTGKEEILLLQALVKAKNLEKGIKKAFGKKKAKGPSVHHVKMKL